MPTFRTPSVKERPYTRHPFWARTYLNRGITLLKFGTSYQRQDDPDSELITAADRVYLGGHIYQIDEDEAAALTVAGYGEWVDGDLSPGDENFENVDYSQYGAGPYGTGPYGV